MYVLRHDEDRLHHQADAEQTDDAFTGGHGSGFLGIFLGEIGPHRLTSGCLALTQPGSSSGRTDGVLEQGRKGGA